MALLSALSGGNLTAIRSNNNYRTLQFVCLVPNTVVVQFHPDAAPSTDVFAEIAVDTPLSGSMSNIRQGMLVIFSSTSDYRETETFRTRVRKVSGTTTLYVAENSQALTTSDFVTVMNTYEVQEKLRRSATLVDWDITFRLLLPIETELPSAVVLTNGGTEYIPPANAIVMDASASTIDTHAWESSNSNDSFDDDTIAQPTITLEAESFRWLRYTFIDDNGNSNYRVIPVWTVPKDYSSVVSLGFGGANGDLADISFDAELGWSATVPAWDGIEDVLNHTFCVIASDEWYNDTRQSIRTNINMVGYLQTEDSDTRGDEAVGKLSETRFSVEGFGHQLARQNVSQITIFRTAGTPSSWDTVQNPTPARMLTYRLSEYSTILNLCSLTIPSDDTDFVGDDITLSNGKALDDIRFIAEVINAELQFDVNGRLDLCRNLNYLDTTARNAAAVVATLSLSDMLAFRYDYDYSKSCSQVTMTGGAYNSTADVYTLYEAISPAVARRSEGDPQPISNQVLTTDATGAASLTEIAERAANYDAANNPTFMASGTLKDEWHFLLPDVGSWIKFDIAGEDTARGKVFSTSDRWQLVQISISTNSETGRRQVDFTARHETSDTGAMVRASQIVNDTQADIVYFPATTLEFSGVPTGDGIWYDSSDTQPPSSPNPPEDADCVLGGFRVIDPVGYSTSRSALNNEYIGVSLRGAGQISAAAEVGEWCHRFNFQDSQAGFVLFAHNGLQGGQYVAGVGWQASDTNIAAGAQARQISIAYTLPVGSFSFVTIIVEYDYTYGHGQHPTIAEADLDMIQFESGSGTDQILIAQGELAGLNFEGTNKIYSNTHPTSAYTWNGSLRVVFGTSYDAVAPLTTSGSATIRAIEIHGTGDNPFTGSGNGEACGDATYGDAFYYWTGTLETPNASPVPYPTGYGVLIEAVQPASIPPYSPTHEYALTPFQVTSGPVLYEYEPLFGTSELENWSVQIETCFWGTEL